MDNREKELYLIKMVDKIVGSVVKEVGTEIEGDNVSAISLIMCKPNGDEFLVKPHNEKGIHIIQTFWGD